MDNMEDRQDKQHVENQVMMREIRTSIEENRNNHDEKYIKLMRLVYMGVGGLAALELILKLPELIKKVP